MRDNTMVNVASQTAAVLAAVAMAGRQEAPPEIPQGEIGGCIGCGHTVVSHFRDGRWVGCLKGTGQTVFILVPVTQAEAKREYRRRATDTVNGNGHGPTVAHERATVVVPTVPPTEPAIVARGFLRARYTSSLHHKAKPEKLKLTPVRMRVLKTVHQSSKAGVRVKDIIKRAKLPHGSVQQTLNWLRQHDAEGNLLPEMDAPTALVHAREDAPIS